MALLARLLPSQCHICRAWPAPPICAGCLACFVRPEPRCLTCAAPLAGSGRDPSDCLPSAGQTWSKLRKACVQVFDVADIRLTDPDNPALAVYVLFSPDKKVAEMFSASFPDGSVMMAVTRGGNSYFANMGRVLLLKDSQSKEGWRIAK